MKLVTVVGTRPELIRLSRIIPKLDLEFEHELVHTGQNFDANLKEIFFKELSIRPPDFSFEIESGNIGVRLSQIFHEFGVYLAKSKPEALLVLGDTFSGLVALVARHSGIPVIHMEAGNRAFSRELPEETNRKVIDNCSDLLMPYTVGSSENLLAEGFNEDLIWVSGNPIYEVINFYRDLWEKLPQDKLSKPYVLATVHRAEGVDDEARLFGILDGLDRSGNELECDVFLSTHPRLRDKLAGRDKSWPNIQFIEPLGFFEFMKMQSQALVVATDSGTVQEEACILGVPCVTLREVTERPETISCGANVLAGYDSQRITDLMRSQSQLKRASWKIPEGYEVLDVSDQVVNKILAFLTNSKD
jgi:UDP-N-acetylglucosamine 2-epimerase (non-hydrolysing)